MKTAGDAVVLGVVLGVVLIVNGVILGIGGWAWYHVLGAVFWGLEL